MIITIIIMKNTSKKFCRRFSIIFNAVRKYKKHVFFSLYCKWSYRKATDKLSLVLLFSCLPVYFISAIFSMTAHECRTGILVFASRLPTMTASRSVQSPAYRICKVCCKYLRDIVMFPRKCSTSKDVNVKNQVNVFRSNCHDPR